MKKASWVNRFRVGRNTSKCATASQQAGEVFCRHRATKEITLNFVTALGAQIVELRLGFHTLGNGPEAQSVGHADDGCDRTGQS